MTSILHISDTHFGTERQLIVEAMEAHVREQGADLLVLSGDITQRARRQQFAAAQAFVRRLKSYGIPETLVIPGNHDLPPVHNPLLRLLCPYGDYRRHFGQELEPIFENDELLLIGLNTTHPMRRKDGRVTADQVRAVCARLRHCDPAKLRIVVAHQPFGLMVPSDFHNIQRGARTALMRWAEAGLDIVMGGHIHLPYVLPLSGQYPELTREIWTVQAGTALSCRVRGGLPNSFNRLYLSSAQGKQARVERWDYHAPSGRFALGAHFDLHWPPAGLALSA
ncbi:3',5'-cyclic AMP phosphodiesterase CpdA [Azotobacter beijerinckii]|uniref:3',5'-cyclic AMP phosphodiesterase CpdA n=1 Tax=Azotobacter beijerinckii TaxID=170623 RepID=A0A1H9IFV9_9GAMM|nr:metallophosphoesterase [Azotobacter beijerinckii]SEJ42413.1 3',5'-cyclic AMP phosphodiesterase CpdA [Azotobacter beijerinckii]SEQ73456.1 3',5'-cyclic AMP phosphodiesterase CpdA [Azotobacter beijerinckii]